MENNKQTVVVSERDSARVVTLSIGDTLIVRLQTQLGTGFRWRPGKSSRSLKMIGTGQIEPHVGDLPGGEETQLMRYEATKSGSCTLTFSYLRAWERKALPARSFNLKVIVR